MSIIFIVMRRHENQNRTVAAFTNMNQAYNLAELIGDSWVQRLRMDSIDVYSNYNLYEVVWDDIAYEITVSLKTSCEELDINELDSDTKCDRIFVCAQNEKHAKEVACEERKAFYRSQPRQVR